MFLTDQQLKSEILRCEFCADKPCKTACPCDCSPADFIMAAAEGKPSDYKRAAGIILSSNPLGGICGKVCPDDFCVQACSHYKFDFPIRIQEVQATIIHKAHLLGQLPEFETVPQNGKKIAIIGGGPSGLGAAVILTQLGYKIDIFDPETLGGQIKLIPPERLESEVIENDLSYLQQVFRFNHIPKKVDNVKELLAKGYDAVLLACGLNEPIKLNIPGSETEVFGLELLHNPEAYNLAGKRIALVGGAIAADAALLARRKGAKYVEMVTLEAWNEMPITEDEKQKLIEAGVSFSPRTRITAIINENGKTIGIKTKRVTLPSGLPFHPTNIIDEEGSTEMYRPFDMVVVAIGNRCSLKETGPYIYQCGDMANGPSTVVEAIASGKNIALKIDADLKNKDFDEPEKPTKSIISIPHWKKYPISLEIDFFGRRINSPFLLSASPPTDGYEQMKTAYLAGWQGGIMKTAFEKQYIHIPGEYMWVFNDKTFGNCDNVSEHPIDRVCEEIQRLIREFPDHLTMASTGGPVTGNDESDKAAWQSNTRKLENAGAMGIEYSLSCPQGGDGTHGDIVAQNAELTAKIIDWVMQISNPEIPKLFKLTSAVTAIVPIIKAVKSVFARYPEKKAGITLANTFPAMGFREKEDARWDEGVIIGLSGKGILPITYLSLARACNLGVIVSGNGGAMSYLDAANFLALGTSTVQFCSIVEKYGYEIIDELHSGLSHLLEAKKMSSVKDLIGIAQPNPITDFQDLPAKSKSSTLNPDLCLQCGNCTRCPYQAIKLDEEKFPVIDKEKCIGCSLCTRLCFTGALYMSKDS
ncbi:MAG: FAD-dependent oxidoreductase [Candidatus Cloacimonadaceae bacterium]|jgi:NADPH-dependent glutamate synthase beta subunit-like oxidoreductase/dihydroorotate dehydrogenase/Pyruvate/2-oxoacid:ferredoxin oxidoreductase delta subunit|nr:FAD-dependent oxidoreductase [Candidatus Cloacimonadota bacterium]MDY0111794.1 FAD-dependent oxidoreductase [Candidatus Syntrophosphaera sp.]